MLRKSKTSGLTPCCVFNTTTTFQLPRFMCFVLPMLLGATWGDAFGGLFIAGALRLVLNHHFTWFINSLCHYAGTRPYSDKNYGTR